jgi:hypothetical protein
MFTPSNFFLHMFGFRFGFRRSELEKSNVFKITRSAGIMSHQNFSRREQLGKTATLSSYFHLFPHACLYTPAMANSGSSTSWISLPCYLFSHSLRYLFIKHLLQRSLVLSSRFTWALQGVLRLFLGIMGVFGNGVDWCSRQTTFLYLRSVYTILEPMPFGISDLAHPFLFFRSQNTFSSLCLLVVHHLRRWYCLLQAEAAFVRLAFAIIFAITYHLQAGKNSGSNYHEIPSHASVEPAIMKATRFPATLCMCLRRGLQIMLD